MTKNALGFYTMARTGKTNETDSVSSLSLGKRLESLEVKETTDVMKEMNKEEKPKALPKTGSLDVILSQILETGDENQFATLNVSNKLWVLENSIKNLNARYILPLLDMIIKRMESNHRLASVYLEWLSIVFTYHSTYLMSVPGSKQRIVHIRRILESRTASYKKMMRLGGRLQMLLQRAQANTKNAVDFSQSQVPLVEVYESSMVPKDGMEEEEEEVEEVEEVEEEEEEEDEEEDDATNDDDDDSLLDEEEEEEE